MSVERALGRARRARAARGRSQMRRLRVPPRMRLAIAVLVLLLAALSGAWLWLRDSSLVSVDQVKVTGASGRDADQIRASLTAAARRMSTLDVSTPKLRAAVARYPVVANLRVSAELPHKLQIRVIERVPIGLLTIGGRAMPVSADGTLLHDISPGAAIPAITARASESRSRVSGNDAQQEVALLAAAPDQLISRLSSVTLDSAHGLTAQVRGGPVIYFGDGSRLTAKWIAATEVLTDPGSVGAGYIDVTDPGRPAAGMGNQSSPTAQSAAPPSTGSTGGG